MPLMTSNYDWSGQLWSWSALLLVWSVVVLILVHRSPDLLVFTLSCAPVRPSPDVSE